MCGISGLLSGPDSGTPRIDVPAVAATLRHRGPDGSGTVTWQRQSNEFSLDNRADADFIGVHTRLAILDLTRASDQPMIDEDRRCALLYNGEIYNYSVLRDELERLGHRFRSAGDTEVVLRSYLEWGPDAFKRFDGMFAVAIVDRESGSLVLARDHLGIKPLYVWSGGGRLAFASELPTIRELIPERATVDPQGLFDYLAFGWTDHGLGTCFKGVVNFPPGHVAIVDLNGAIVFKPDAYWELPTAQEDIRFDEAVDEVRALLLESVKLQLRSDVPVGLMLSGGIDSATLLSATRRVLGTEADRLTAYGYDAETPELSERSWMEAAASQARVRLKVERYEDERVFADLREMVGVQGEPVNSSSALAQRRLYACMAGDGVKVALGGQGADEIFAGYHILRQRMIDAAVHAEDYDAAMCLIGGTRPEALFREFTDDLEVRRKQLRRRRASGTADLTKLRIRADWFRERGVDVDRPLQHQVPDTLHDALRDLTCRHSLPRLLRYDDRNAMSVSVENRVPFLSRSLVERAFTLPARYLLSPFGCTKFVLREAARDLIPASTRRRHDKIGFATPESVMFRTHGKEIVEMLEGVDRERVPFLDHAAVRDELEMQRSSEAEFDPRAWRWVNVVVWLSQIDAALE